MCRGGLEGWEAYSYWSILILRSQVMKTCCLRVWQGKELCIRWPLPSRTSTHTPFKNRYYQCNKTYSFANASVANHGAIQVPFASHIQFSGEAHKTKWNYTNYFLSLKQLCTWWYLTLEPRALFWKGFSAFRALAYPLSHYFSPRSQSFY